MRAGGQPIRRGAVGVLLTKTVELGPEYDEDIVDQLKAALRRLGAERISNWTGQAGSQEVSQATFSIDGERVVVVIETYMGVTLSGPERIVDTIVAAMTPPI